MNTTTPPAHGSGPARSALPQLCACMHASCLHASTEEETHPPVAQQRSKVTEHPHVHAQSRSIAPLTLPARCAVRTSPSRHSLTPTATPSHTHTLACAGPCVARCGLPSLTPTAHVHCTQQPQRSDHHISQPQQQKQRLFMRKSHPGRAQEAGCGEGPLWQAQP